MEARIYKPKRLRNGKRTMGRLYRARIKLAGDSKVRDIALEVSDKQVAQQKLNKLIQELEHESAGLIPARLEREAAQSPLLDLVAEYVHELTVLGRSDDHLRHVNTRLRRLVRECHWARLADVTPIAFQTWRKAQTDKSPKTLNEYLAVLSAFWTWLRKQGRVAVNPFELVERADTRGKKSFQRRALNDEEARQLLATPRKLLYLLAMHTGLRRGEIKKLRGSYLHLDSANPFYALPADIVKNRKEEPRPLHPELVAALQDLQAAGQLKPEALVFPDGVPAMKEIRKDFKQAGIPVKDELGHIVDFHALRTTYITRLQRAGVSPREAMELARHSDMRLTMKTYTDVAQLPLAATVRGLPSIGDSRIDSRTLGASGQTVSLTVPANVGTESENNPEKIGESRNSTPAVAACHSEPANGEMGFESPPLRHLTLV